MNRKPDLKFNIDRENLRTSLESACEWIVDIAQVKTDELIFEKNKYNLHHRKWKGAVRGEYSAAKAEWDFFCPIWHTGQCVKALVSAYNVLKDERLLEAAKSGADFIGSERMGVKNDE
jgi:hypothetical protein